MPLCPRGHESAADDYCDHCGAPMHGPVAVPQPEPPPAPPADGPCPVCGNPLEGRFCEYCGHDSLAGPPSTVTEPAAEVVPAAVGSWLAVVTPDRDYYERVRAMNGPDVDAVVFPKFCPERRFPLDAGAQVLIGRHSRSRGVYPGIDLTGPPEDTAVSHTHALLVPDEAGWAIVDLRSANCTYLNGSTKAIEPESPTPLADGDYVNVGAWTRLTLRAQRDLS